ncbi:MAG: sulfotransferase domain-containing protein [Pseudomonadales bacterium]|nr:sulfotransferase domain-containing protein [Pseudomonadales bacterium]
MPDFIIIGAQKAGTSSLFHYLGQHPEIIQSYQKEVHFFDGGLDPIVDNYYKGEQWYRAHFPYKQKMKRGFKTFEASPLYIYNPLSPKRISQLTPKIKIILLLRNPSERAISHYFHETRIGREFLPVLEALQAEDKRLGPYLRKQDYKNDIFIQKSYKRRGIYKEQIDRFLQYFSPEQMLVLSSEEFFSAPGSALKRIFNFVEVNDNFVVKDLVPRNIGSNRNVVDQKVYDYLDNYYVPHNKELYELLREDYHW